MCASLGRKALCRAGHVGLHPRYCNAKNGPQTGAWELKMANESDQAASAERVIIQKYANRRLYNKATSTYITLENLAEMVRNGVDFVVYDAKTNEDITRKVLTQIIFDEENRG